MSSKNGELRLEIIKSIIMRALIDEGLDEHSFTPLFPPMACNA